MISVLFELTRQMPGGYIQSAANQRKVTSLSPMDKQIHPPPTPSRPAPIGPRVASIQSSTDSGTGYTKYPHGKQ
jgi:hypothetical protein